MVNTLLQVGDRVLEISRDELICEIWGNEAGVSLEDHDELVGRSLADIDAKFVYGKCREHVAESFRTGQNTLLETILTLNGHSIRYILRVLPIHPDLDRLFLVAERVKTPIREGKETIATELKDGFEQRSDFFDRVMNTIPGDVVVLDSDYRFLYVNREAVRNEESRRWLLGKTDEEYFRLKGRPIAIAEKRKEKHELARNERRVIEWVETSYDSEGAAVHIQRKICPLFDDKGGLDIIVGYSMNLTDLINTQEELKTNKDTFESAFHDSGIGMAIMAPDGKWLDVNNVLCEMTGYSREELMKVHVREITFPDDRRPNKEMVERMMRKEIPNYTMERRYISKSGKIVHALFTLSLVWSRNELPRFFIAQVVDITKMKDLEFENSRKNMELEQVKMNLINKVNQLEELSYIIAHNLRGPAGNIGLLTDALLAQNDGEELEGGVGSAFTMSEGLSYIKESSDNLMSSLSSLMQIVEIKLNKTIPTDECDLREMVSDITKQLQSTIFESRASINTSFVVETILYPRIYLESILYNFISNALKYSRSDLAPEIIITTRTNAGKIQLSVKDNGLGIDMDRYGDKLFKLSQVFHTGKDSKGFGLYLTKTQVESLGGSISVTSRPNEGSEFVVTF